MEKNLFLNYFLVVLMGFYGVLGGRGLLLFSVLLLVIQHKDEFQTLNFYNRHRQPLLGFE